MQQMKFSLFVVFGFLFFGKTIAQNCDQIRLLNGEKQNISIVESNNKEIHYSECGKSSQSFQVLQKSEVYCIFYQNGKSEVVNFPQKSLCQTSPKNSHDYDLLVKLSGEEVKAKISEVGVNEIKYTLQGLSSPIYTILKNDLALIEYGNGNTEFFQLQMAETKPNHVASQSKGVGIGVRGGINVMRIQPNYQLAKGVSINSIKTFSVGVPIEIRFSEYFALQPEINYTQKGATVNSFTDTTLATYSINIKMTGTSTEKYHYLDLPILAKVGAGNKMGRIDFCAGPYLGIGLGGINQTTQVVDITPNNIYLTDSKQDTTYSIKVGKDIRNIEMGLNLGATLSLNLSKGARLFFDTRYLLGLSDYFTLDTDYPNNKVFHRGFSFSLGILGFSQFGQNKKN